MSCQRSTAWRYFASGGPFMRRTHLSVRTEANELRSTAASQQRSVTKWSINSHNKWAEQMREAKDKKG